VNKPLKLDLKDLARLPEGSGLLLVLGLALLGLLGLFSWQFSQILAQQQALAEIRGERQRLELVAASNQQLEHQLRELSNTWELGQARLPEGQDYAGLVRLLGSLSQAEGVRLGPLNPAVVTGQGVFAHITTPVEMSGSFPRVIALMNRLQNAGRAIILRDVAVALEEGGNVRAKMVLKAYYQPGQP
jgi:Tfp pilus assembly protein PilO